MRLSEQLSKGVGWKRRVLNICAVRQADHETARPSPDDKLLDAYSTIFTSNAAQRFQATTVLRRGDHRGTKQQHDIPWTAGDSFEAAGVEAARRAEQARLSK
jgi:hypothetical protein